jgi:hypothetical protein
MWKGVKKEGGVTKHKEGVYLLKCKMWGPLDLYTTCDLAT